jgi:hypothetical protein
VVDLQKKAEEFYRVCIMPINYGVLTLHLLREGYNGYGGNILVGYIILGD